MAPSRFWLLLRSSEGSAAAYALPLGEHIFGRDQLRAHFGIVNETVSSEHMRLLCTESGCSVEDRSIHGTWHNGTRLALRALTPLADHDWLTIGEDAGIQTTLELVDDLRRSVEDRDRLWWATWVDGENLATAAPVPLPLLEQGSVFLIDHLPECYRQEPGSFVRRFLALFDHVLLPLRWNVSNFDLFLDPMTAPTAFLSWLAQWYYVTVDASWTEAQRRQLLASAPYIYPRLGTAAALSHVLKIYTDATPTIHSGGGLPLGAFEVRIAPSKRSEEQLRAIIDVYKPVHANYRIIIEDGA